MFDGKHLENKNPDAFYYAQNYVLTCQCTSKAVRKNVDGNKIFLSRREKEIMNETRTKRDLLETMEKLNKQSKKNKEQKEEAFTFLNTAVEIGNKIFCCIPVKLLRIDHEMYQRLLQKSFKHLLDNWDGNKCDPITVNYRSDGFYYVINGQHRTEAAKGKRD